jgi:DNA-binding transcriptional ArsR family regulator
MVEHSAARLDGVFLALADPTRRAMVARLARGEATVGDLAAPFSMTFQGASKHLHVLERAGLVQGRRVGRTRRLRLAPGRMGDAAAWIERTRAFWEGKLDALERHLDQDGEGRGGRGPERSAQ